MTTELRNLEEYYAEHPMSDQAITDGACPRFYSDERRTEPYYNKDGVLVEDPRHAELKAHG